MCVFSEKFLSKSSNFQIFIIFICFYLLNNNFGQGGINIFLDEVSVLTYFFIIIFLYKKFNFSYENVFFIILLLTSALLLKKTHLHLFIIPFFLYIFLNLNNKRSLFKYIVIIFSLPIFIFYLQNLQFEKHNNSKLAIFSNLSEIQKQDLQNKEDYIKFDINVFKSSLLETTNVYDRYKVRFQSYSENKLIQEKIFIRQIKY